MGGARNARHRGGAGAHGAPSERLRLVPCVYRRVPHRRARRSGHPRRDAVPLVLVAGARADPGRVPGGNRRAGLRVRHLPGRLSVEPWRREPQERARRGHGRTCRPRRVARRRGLLVRASLRAAQRPEMAAAQRARRRRQRGGRARARRSAAARRGRRPDARRARTLGARTDEHPRMTRLRRERWIAIVRLVAVPFAVFQVAVTVGVPDGYQTAGWVTTAVFAAGAIVLFPVSRRNLSDRGAFALAVTGQIFETAVVSAYVIAYSLERGTLTPEVLFFPLIAGCVRFGVPGGAITAAASAPVMVVFELLHSRHFD